MLTRIANSFYWAGRYLERSEHLARYLRVQYDSTLDSPDEKVRAFTLKSILRMYGMEWPEDQPLREAEVLRKVGMDYDCAQSIRSTVRATRENASSLRHVISSELWEAINEFYLKTQAQDPEYFVGHGLHEFTERVGKHCAFIRSRIDDTLLRDEAWIFIKLGIHLERSIQVLRILNTKLQDLDIVTRKKANQAERQYQGTVILHILEGFDMHRKAYHQLLTPETMVEFLIGHPHFSRSVSYNMNAVRSLLARLDKDYTQRDPVLFKAGKLYNHFRYLEHDDIKDDIGDHLSKALDRVYGLHDAITQKYFVAT